MRNKYRSTPYYGIICLNRLVPTQLRDARLNIWIDLGTLDKAILTWIRNDIWYMYSKKWNLWINKMKKKSDQREVAFFFISKVLLCEIPQ